MARQCSACKIRLIDFDHKDSALAKYLSSWTRIKGRKDNRLCSRHQRSLTRAIKRARFLALLPYVNR